MDLNPILRHLEGDGRLDWVHAIEQLVQERRTLSDELLRVRTRGHGAAHELDNIAIEAGLGHSPAAGTVADYVRQLRALHGVDTAAHCAEGQRTEAVAEAAELSESTRSSGWDHVRFELGVEDMKLLHAAKIRGYLRCDASMSYNVELAWLDRCRRERVPCVVVAVHHRLKNRVTVGVSLPPAQRLSGLGIEEIALVLRKYCPAPDGSLRHDMGVEGFDWSPRGVRFGPLREKALASLLPALRTLIEHDQSAPRQREIELLGEGPVEGMATCVDNQGLEHLLQVGEVCYIREIPNMRGHCIILRDGQPPRVGYHLDRFELER